MYSRVLFSWGASLLVVMLVQVKVKPDISILSPGHGLLVDDEDGPSNSTSSQFQPSHKTNMNRYPDEYSFVLQYMNDKKKKGAEHEHEQSFSGQSKSPNNKVEEKKTRLLSFGASTGLEAITLATMYFNETAGHGDVAIYGVDLHQPSLDEAFGSAWVRRDIPDGKITFFNGNRIHIRDFGPYDVIFANSVLCYFGNKIHSARDVVEHFPFERFEDALVDLDASLKVGGLLAMVNVNYEFGHVDPVSKRYRALSKCANFVPKVNRDTLTYYDVPRDRESNQSLWDCIWVKES